MVNMVGINTNYTDSTKYRIKLSRINKMMVTKEFLKSNNVPYIGSITIYSEDYINKSKNITQEQLRISCFQKCYHLYNRNSNTEVTNYLDSIPNQCLD